MPGSSKWAIKPCFSGEECWCRTIVGPNGREVVPPASVWKKNAAFIVEVMNGTQADKTIPPDHPLPWHIMTVDGGWKMIVTTEGLRSDELEHMVVSPQPPSSRLEVIVEAVNAFYHDLPAPN